MNSAAADFLGINADVFHWLIIPLGIFLARITDVSINTLRVMLMMNGRKVQASVLGFFESGIWLLAISQILQNLDHWLSYLAYAGGYATGVYVGLKLEERLAVGKVVVRIITASEPEGLVTALRQRGFGLTKVNAEGTRGPVKLIFTTIKRERMPQLEKLISEHEPGAFYSVEAVKFSTDLPYTDSDNTSSQSFFKTLFYTRLNRK